MILRLFCLLLLSPVLAQTPPSLGTGSISGKVTIEGKPAPGVSVRIQKSDEQWNPSKTPPTVMTDHDGIFKLDRLPAAQYVIAPSVPGFYNPQKKSQYQDGIYINLGDGEQASGQDFALKRGAVVTGRLSDGSGRSLIEQPVVLKKVGGQGKSQTIQCSERTDDRGIYRCYGLEPGKYIVGAGSDPKDESYPMLGAQTYARVWYPSVAQEEQATPLELTVEKETANIDLKLERKKKGFKVMGRVFDADTGKAVPNVMLGIGTISENGNVTGMTFGGGSGSNAEGEFKIEGVAKGKYRAIPRAWTALEYFGDGIEFEVDDSDVTNLEIKMHKGAVIQGTVALEEGAPPEAQKNLLTITLVANARDPKAKDSDWYATSYSNSGIDSAGNVQFKGVRGGQVTIRLEGSGAKGLSIARLERNGAPITESLRVTAGETITGLRIVLAQGSATLRGEIKVEGGTLPEDVSMRIRAKPANKSQSEMFGSVDPRGKYQIEYLSSGSYELIVETYANRPPYDKPSATLQTNSKTVQVTPGQDSTVNLTVTIGSTSKEEKQ
jgi:hypothetical protein